MKFLFNLSIVLFIIIQINCSSKPIKIEKNQQPVSDKQVTEAIDDILEVYQEFYDLLEKHRDNPSRALESGDIFIEDNKKRLHSNGYILGKINNNNQLKILHEYTIRVSVMSRKTGELLGPYYSAYPNAIDELGKMVETIGIYCARGAEKALKQ